jgi:hypothetical protein
MIPTGDPDPNRPNAINCDDPAKTKADIANAPQNESPLVSAKVPKMMPNGIAPTMSGIVCLAPDQNSLQGVVGGIESDAIAMLLPLRLVVKL